MLHIVDDEVGLLVGVDLVESAHGALQLQRQAVRLRAVDAVFQLADRAQNARTIGAHAAILTNQAKLHRVPVQTREHFAGTQFGGLQPALTVGLNEVGHDGVE